MYFSASLQKLHKVPNIGPVETWVRIDHHFPLLFIQRKLNRALVQIRLQNPRVPYHSRFRKINIPLKSPKHGEKAQSLQPFDSSGDTCI
jgi:hypothetical protein